MADFDQLQNEFDQFLEQTVNPQTQPAQPNVPPQEKPPMAGTEDPDDDINQYLGGDDEVPPAETSTGAQPGTQPNSNQPPAQPTEAERILALERELAASRAKAEIYENAIKAGYSQPASQPNQEPPAPTTLYTDEELTVDDRYEADYGDVNPYIQSIARKVANDLYQRTVVPLKEELGRVTNQLNEQRGVNEQNQRFSFETQLRRAVPDLDEIAFSQEWQSYLKQPAPYTGGTATIAHVVQSGIQSGNMKQVVEVIEDFKSKRSQSQPQSQQMAPGRAQTTQPPTAPRGAKVLRMSDFERATANFQAGKLSWDKYQRISEEFNNAMLEGRVNTNR